MRKVIIGNITVNEKSHCLIIVDAGVNHNNSIKRGIEIIEKAAQNGADVVKFQTYKANSITTKKAPRYWNEKLDTDKGGTQYDTFSRIDGMDIDGYKKLKKKCDKLGVVFCSTPFNLPDVDLLEEIGMDIYKISSSDLTYLQLIEYIATKGKPMILSTGCGTIGEIEKAIDVIIKKGNDQIILQHCILQYPCNIENANLAKMRKIQEIFPEIPVGYSDHTIGSIVPISAVALGARTIEKHFTIDKKLPDSPDHKLSASPEDLKEMVLLIRKVEKSIGYFHNGFYPAEEKAYKYARKSIVSNVYIPRGKTITDEMLTCKRPGTGIYPDKMDFVIGSTAKVDIPEDTTITKEMI